MDLSLIFFSADERTQPSYDFILESARIAEETGFAALWFPERHFDRFGGPFPNPALMCAAVAGITQRIRLRPGSIVFPLHDVVRLAEDWAVVDRLSKGRVDMAFATGWDANSFCLMPDAYERREEITLAGIDQFRALWDGKPLPRRNGTGEEVSIVALPRPNRPPPELWLTVAKQAALFEEAGRRGLNVLTALLFQPIERVAENIKLYRQARARSGRDPDTGKVTLMLHAFAGDDEGSSTRLATAALHEYIQSSVALWRHESATLRELSPSALESMVAFATQRYIKNSSLIGDASQISQKILGFHQHGVNEIACLIDFGISEPQVLKSITNLSRAWRATSQHA